MSVYYTTSGRLCLNFWCLSTEAGKMQPSLCRGSHLQMEDVGEKLLERQCLLQETAKRHQHEQLSSGGEHWSGVYSHPGWGCPHSPKELWSLRPRIIPAFQQEWDRPWEMPPLLHLDIHPYLHLQISECYRFHISVRAVKTTAIRVLKSSHSHTTSLHLQNSGVIPCPVG